MSNRKPQSVNTRQTIDALRFASQFKDGGTSKYFEIIGDIEKRTFRRVDAEDAKKKEQNVTVSLVDLMNVDSPKLDILANKIAHDELTTTEKKGKNDKAYRPLGKTVWDGVWKAQREQQPHTSNLSLRDQLFGFAGSQPQPQPKPEPQPETQPQDETPSLREMLHPKITDTESDIRKSSLGSSSLSSPLIPTKQNGYGGKGALLGLTYKETLENFTKLKDELSTERRLQKQRQKAKDKRQRQSALKKGIQDAIKTPKMRIEAPMRAADTIKDRILRSYIKFNRMSAEHKQVLPNPEQPIRLSLTMPHLIENLASGTIPCALDPITLAGSEKFMQLSIVTHEINEMYAQLYSFIRGTPTIRKRVFPDLTLLNTLYERRSHIFALLDLWPYAYGDTRMRLSRLWATGNLGAVLLSDLEFLYETECRLQLWHQAKWTADALFAKTLDNRWQHHSERCHDASQTRWNMVKHRPRTVSNLPAGFFDERPENQTNFMKIAQLRRCMSIAPIHFRDFSAQLVDAWVLYDTTEATGRTEEKHIEEVYTKRNGDHDNDKRNGSGPVDQRDIVTQRKWQQFPGRRCLFNGKRDLMGYSIEIKFSPVHRYGVFSNRAFLKTSMVYESEVSFYATTGRIPHGHAFEGKRICDHCGTRIPEVEMGVEKCGFKGCMTRFCSYACKRVAKAQYHDVICCSKEYILKDFSHERSVGTNTLNLLMILQIIGQTMSCDQWPCSPHELPELKHLLGSRSYLDMGTSFATLIEYWDQIVNCAAVMGIPYFDFQSFCSLLYKLMRHGMRWRHGLMLSDFTSMVNHHPTNQPNVRVVSKKPAKQGERPRVQVFALRDITPGEELFVSYEGPVEEGVPLTKPKNISKNKLSDEVNSNDVPTKNGLTPIQCQMYGMEPKWVESTRWKEEISWRKNRTICLVMTKRLRELSGQSQEYIGQRISHFLIPSFSS